MAREFFKDLPDTSTPITASRINGLLNGDEALGSIVVDDVSCKNLFNFNSSKFGYVLSGTGTENSSSGFLISDYIAVQPNTTYSISRVFNSVTGAENTMRIGYYQANKTFIDRPASSDNPYTITTPSNCYYVRLSYQYQSQGQTSNDKVQIEQGSVATPYTPYKKIIKEENGYVKENTTFYANDFKCKNLCNGINQSVFLTSAVNSGQVLSGNTGLYIKVNGGNYTISTTASQARYRVACMTAEPSETAQTAYNGVNKDGTSDTITINTSGYNYLIVNATDLSKIQIEVGDTATSFTPYKAFENGADDTGWVVLNSTRNVYYRVKNSVVFIKISDYTSATINSLSNLDLGTLPSHLKPSYSIAGSCYMTDSHNTYLSPRVLFRVLDTGVVRLQNWSDTNVTYNACEGSITYII